MCLKTSTIDAGVEGLKIGVACLFYPNERIEIFTLFPDKATIIVNINEPQSLYLQMKQADGEEKQIEKFTTHFSATNHERC